MKDHNSYTKQDWLQCFARSPEDCKNYTCIDSPNQWLTSYVFNITTYSRDIDDIFVKEMVGILNAISNKRNQFYQNISEHHTVTFVLYCNYPFIYENINWGTSIWSCWWDPSAYGFSFGSGLLDLQGELFEDDLIFTTEGWETFISAVVEFAEIKEVK